MWYSWSIFLLLVVVDNLFAEARLREVVENTIHKLRAPRKKDCEDNNYKHDPAIFPKLNGYFYTLYTSAAFADNEIVKYYPMGDGMVFSRTTTDGDCCRTVNVTLGQEHNEYTVESDADCSTKISDDSAQSKHIASNTEEVDGSCESSCCIISWTCRKTRQGVLTLCDKRNVSQAQDEWIHKQYDQLGLKPLKVEQSNDYREGKCFSN